MPVCFIGIGSNLGDRKKNIRIALSKIEQLKGTRIIKISRIIQTEPQEVTSKQSKFLNAAVKIQTSLTPVMLFKKLQKIEIELGRPAGHAYHVPRTIDLDILFYGDKVVNREDLKIPHPKVFERDFVLRPLMEVI